MAENANKEIRSWWCLPLWCILFFYLSFFSIFTLRGATVSSQLTVGQEMCLLSKKIKIITLRKQQGLALVRAQASLENIHTHTCMDVGVCLRVWVHLCVCVYRCVDSSCSYSNKSLTLLITLVCRGWLWWHSHMLAQAQWHERSIHSGRGMSICH